MTDAMLLAEDAHDADLDDGADDGHGTWLAQLVWSTAIVVASAAIGALAQGEGNKLGYPAAILGGAVLGALAARRSRSAPVFGLLGVAGLLGSPFVQVGAENAATLTAVVACIVAVLVVPGRLWLPNRATAAALGAYVAVLVLSAATSIARGTSLSYFAGTTAVLTVAFVAVPTLLAGAWRRLLIGLAAIAGVVAVSSLVLWFVGTVYVGDLPLGVYYVIQLTIGASIKWITLPRASGIYLRPGAAGMTLAIGCVAALALVPVLRRRRLPTAAVAAGLALATLLTFARSAQLGLLAGGVLLLAGRRWRRPFVIATVVVVLGVTLAMAADKLGALDRLDLTVKRNGQDATEAITNAGSDTTSGVGSKVRGGTDLSSRGALWQASVDAIKDRPLFGFGPGTDATAIGPRLPAGYESYIGLSSHSTPLRIGVETGVAGLLALIAIHLTTLWHATRRHAPSAWVLVALIGTSVGLGLTETLSFGGFLFASVVWTAAVGVLAAVPVTAEVPELLRPWRRRATGARDTGPAAPAAPIPSRG